MTESIWIADDDSNVRFVLASAMRDAGYEVRDFADAQAVRDALASATPVLLITDVRMPGDGGLDLLRVMSADHPAIPVIVMSAFTDVATTAAAYRASAADYLAKPFDLDQVLATVQRVLVNAGTPNKPAGPPAAAPPAPMLMGGSGAMHEVFRLIGRVSATDLNVLVTGETGTGKELVARALHDESRRREGPFIALNTAAIPAELLESELFGHEAGAFTGARQRHVGRFEQAADGTLFLDEIGDMPVALQTRLLRVLAGGEFYRVGGRTLIRSHVRIVAATHQDLDALVEQGRFRADLKHRLDVVRIALPPLRARRADIPGLAQHFLDAAAHELGLPPRQFNAKALTALKRRDYPGNVRELENLCRRAAVMAPGHHVGVADLGKVSAARGADGGPGWTQALREWADGELVQGADGVYPRALEALERTLIDAALQHAGGQRQRAARQLGLGRNTLTRKVQSYKLDK
ncbi:MAG TPA: nitrogen regulation protein NR(I) [Oleiagrimonas sp.]|nr:nitrogen regulation protein NR(I) [Oleiagrimonas sp.]